MGGQELVNLCRVRVVAEADPAALARVIERFQNINVVPRRVAAEFGCDQVLHIQVDVSGVPLECVRLIVQKIRQATSVVDAHWHPLV
jgi:hypothetical protein